MLDYIASKNARQEHERRIRSLTPVQEHDDWLKDDRQLSIYPILAGIASDTPDQPGWLSQWLGQLLTATGNRLSALGERMQQEQNNALEVSLGDHKHNGIAG